MKSVLWYDRYGGSWKKIRIPTFPSESLPSPFSSAVHSAFSFSTAVWRVPKCACATVHELKYAAWIGAQVQERRAKKRSLGTVIFLFNRLTGPQNEVNFSAKAKHANFLKVLWKDIVYKNHQMLFMQSATCSVDCSVQDSGALLHRAPLMQAWSSGTPETVSRLPHMRGQPIRSPQHCTDRAWVSCG